MTGIPKSRLPNISVRYLRLGYSRCWVFTTLGIVKIGYSVLLPVEGWRFFKKLRRMTGGGGESEGV